MKPAETAVTEWQAANVGHTQVNLNASVRRDITGKVYSMSARVSLQFLSNSQLSVAAYTMIPKLKGFSTYCS